VQDPLYDDFQATVAECLIRHKSILDVLTKLQESSARINRAVSKAVTSCGCVAINASKPTIPADISLDQLRDRMSHHVEGVLCEHCRDILETELGRTLFYLAALCNTMDLNLRDIVEKEHRRITALGVFNIS